MTVVSRTAFEAPLLDRPLHPRLDPLVLMSLPWSWTIGSIGPFRT